MKYSLFYIVVALFFLYLQCKLSVFVVGLLPGFTAVEHSGSAHLPDDIRDSGFSILPVTPYRLPDLHLAIAVLLTVFNRNKANCVKAPKQASLAHHVLYFIFVALVLCYQYNLFTTYPPTDPTALIPLKAPFHEQSLFAHTNQFHISTHAILLTLLMLCSKFYQPMFQPESRHPWLYIAWFLGVSSIISSRVEFTQDVARGCFFAVVAFYSYFYMVSSEDDEKQQLRAIGAARRNLRMGLQNAESAQAVARPVDIRPPQAPPNIAPVCYEPDGEINRLRDLYLTLMQSALTNTLYMDPPIVTYDPTNRLQFISNAKFCLETRNSGQDLPSQAHCRCGGLRLKTIRNCFETVLSRAVAGDLIDIGVWRGGEAAFMKAVLIAFDIQNRRIIGVGHFRGPVLLSNRLQFVLKLLSTFFPTFIYEKLLLISSLVIPGVKAFPTSTKVDSPEGAWNQYRLKNPDVFSKSTSSTDLDSVKDMFQRHGLFDDKVLLLPGAIPEVLTTIQSRTFALIRIASGVSSHEILESLRNVYPSLSSGGFVIIDDYLSSKTAVDHFRAERNCEDLLLWADRQCVYWRKSA